MQRVAFREAGVSWRHPHSGRRVPRGLILLAAATLLVGCSTTTTNVYLAAGALPVCTRAGDALGVVAVLPEAAWRPDQKDVSERIAMAERALARAFEALPCGSLAAPGGVRPFSPWSRAAEETSLRELAEAGVETAIYLRVEELTPRVSVTLSLPFLWSSTSEADFRVRIVQLPSRTVRLDARIQRSTGGAFQLRPAAWAEEELVRALEEVLQGRVRGP